MDNLLLSKDVIVEAGDFKRLKDSGGDHFTSSLCHGKRSESGSRLQLNWMKR